MKSCTSNLFECYNFEVVKKFSIPRVKILSQHIPQPFWMPNIVNRPCQYEAAAIVVCFKGTPPLDLLAQGSLALAFSNYLFSFRSEEEKRKKKSHILPPLLCEDPTRRAKKQN